MNLASIVRFQDQKNIQPKENRTENNKEEEKELDVAKNQLTTALLVIEIIDEDEMLVADY